MPQPENPGNKPDNPGGKPDNPGGGPPDHAPGRTKWLDALARSRRPMRPIEVFEEGENTKVPGPERGTKGAATARGLKALVHEGDVYAVYRDDDPEQATRYGPTASGRAKGRDKGKK